MNQFFFGKRKVAIIGAGFVGASIAYSLTIRNLAREIVLIDIDKKKAESESLDIQHGIPYMGISTVYPGDFCDCKDCDLIVITAGRNRKIGESRLSLISDNVQIMKNVVQNISRFYTKGVIMIVSNPVDILTYLCSKWMGLPSGRVLGTGCILDTSRFVRCIADYTRLNTEVVKGFIVGEHGDSQVPLWSRLSIAGFPMDEYCDNVGLPWNDDVRESISDKVKNMGALIIEGKCKTHYGIATCVCSLAEAILNQRLTIASVSTPLEGEYGERNVSLSLPSIIGVNGVEKRLKERWSDKEFKSFKENAEKLKKVIRSL